MALKGSKTTKPAANTMPKADAFLNLSVIDANGVPHRLPKGLAMFLKDKVGKSLINAELRNQEMAKAAGVEAVPVTFNFTGTIWIAPEETEEEIPFGI